MIRTQQITSDPKTIPLAVLIENCRPESQTFQIFTKRHPKPKFMEKKQPGACPSRTKRIFYIHFRDVVGSVDNFHETFIDCGQVDTFEVVKLLHRLDFKGFMITDHVPKIEGDTAWGHRGRAHCIGFMQALIQAVEKLNK